MERMVDVRTLNLEEMREHVAQLLRVNRQLMNENRELKALLEEVESTRKKFQLASKIGLLVLPTVLILGFALANH